MNWRVAAVAAAFAAMPLSASSTTPTSTPGARLVHKPKPRAGGRLLPHYTSCVGFGNLGIYAFIGGGLENIARGQQSGILAGYSNQACLQFDGIAAGQSNSTLDSGHASFIGAGSDSIVDGSYEAFIGAGNGLSVSYSDNGSVVAGQGNDVENGAVSALVGGGANNSNQGPDGFVGAGTAGTAHGEDSFVGAGSNVGSTGPNSSAVSGAGNDAYGNQSFSGAGQTNVLGVLATNGFVGAGTGNSALGNSSFVGSGTGNKANGANAFIGAGGTNDAGASAFIGAGSANAAGPSSFVGAGYKNAASGSGGFVGAGGMAFFQAGTSGANSAAGTDAFVGAGDGNVAGATHSVVAGGVSNRILHTTAGGATGATDAVIGGGYENIIQAATSGGAAYSVLAGGQSNLVTGGTAAVGGGAKNAASGSYGTVPGGFDDRAAGLDSFAAGTNSGALHNGTFVWSDDAGSAALNSTAPYQFLARASGGFFLFSNATATAGVKLSPSSGAWASLSDRNMKTAILPLDGAAVLDKLERLPVSKWSYTSERGVRHVGPMAQDFYAAFEVGEDDRHITTIDEDGVALAAIKSLYAKSERNNASAVRENEALRTRISQERRELARLTERVAALVSHAGLHPADEGPSVSSGSDDGRQP
jgi:hypothetical protein